MCRRGADYICTCQDPLCKYNTRQGRSVCYSSKICIVIRNLLFVVEYLEQSKEYRPCWFQHVGFRRVFFGYNFKVIYHNVDTYLIQINEKMQHLIIVVDFL